MKQQFARTGHGHRAVLGFGRTAEAMQWMLGRLITFLGFFLLGGIVATPAWSETAAPSVHWGSMAFPDQYTLLRAGITFNRFTPIDGLGDRYDSTVDHTLGFNFATLSWTQHWGGDWKHWSTNLTLGIGPTRNQPTEFLQNNFVHHLRGISTVPTVDPRKAVDAMIDGSVTRWFPLFRPKVIFVGGGFSVGTIYQQGFLRAGIRRVQVTPALYSGSWGDVSVRASAMGRISYQDNGAVLHHIRQTAGIVQPAVAFGQYRTTDNGETIPAWEIEFALMWGTGIFVNEVGESQKHFAWSLAALAGPVRFETWNDSMGNIAQQDYGPTYGATLTIDVLRIWYYFRD